MINLTEITVIVRAYLDDAAAVVEQPIIDSVHFLSNLFSIDSIDTSQSTVVAGTTLDIPTNGVEINSVFIDGEEVRQLKNLDHLETVNNAEEQRWYEFGGKIQFTKAFTTVETTSIWYKKGYTEPAAAVDTDVPYKMLELVYLGAQYRYYNILLAQVATKRDSVPDVEPDELRKIRDDIKKSYFDQIKLIKQNA